MTIKNETFLMIFKLYEETYYLQRPRGACPRSNAMPDTWVRIFIAYWHERLKELKGTLECFFKVKQLRFVLRDASRPSSWQHQRCSDAWCREYIFGVDLHLKPLNQFNRQVLATLFEIFIFCSKIQLWFPEKIVDYLGWKTRENVVVLDFLAVDNFDFTRKIVKKNLDEKLVKMLRFWTHDTSFF